MRVIAGFLGSRSLSTPPTGVRPTSDRVRESLFGRLGDLSDCRVLDLFAGSGSLGIEAISRGASEVVFIERAGPALRCLDKNLRSLELEPVSTVIRGKVQGGLRRLIKESREFDLILMDPPYASEEYGPVLEILAGCELLALQGRLVVESAKRHSLALLVVAPLQILDERKTGDTTITRLTRTEGDSMSKSKEKKGKKNSGDKAKTTSDSDSDGYVMRRPTVALFPASFDPPTNGHLDLIARAQRVFDEVVVAVAINVGKTGTFSFEERVAMLESVTNGMDGVRVEGFSGLVVEHAKAIGATVMVRGLRATVDFEYEFEMALMNRHIEPDLEVLFMMTSLEHLYVSSSRLKELVRFGSDVSDFVPPEIAKRLVEKLGPS